MTVHLAARRRRFDEGRGAITVLGLLVSVTLFALGRALRVVDDNIADFDGDTDPGKVA